MFCRNCGKEIEADGKFCKECGAPNGEPIQNKNPGASIFSFIKTEDMRDVNFYGAIISTIVLTVLMFQGWIRIPDLSSWGLGNISVSWFGAFTQLRFINNTLKDFGGSNISTISEAIFLSGALALLCIVSIIFMTLFVIKLFSDIEHSAKFGRIAMNLILVVSVITIIAVFIINSSINNKTNMLFSNVLELTAMPFIELVGSLFVQFVFIKKINIST